MCVRKARACGHPTASPHQLDEHQVVLHMWSWVMPKFTCALFFKIYFITWRLCKYKLTTKSCLRTIHFGIHLINYWQVNIFNKKVGKSEKFAGVNALYLCSYVKKSRWIGGSQDFPVQYGKTQQEWLLSHRSKHSHEVRPDNTLKWKFLAASSEPDLAKMYRK